MRRGAVLVGLSLGALALTFSGRGHPGWTPDRAIAGLPVTPSRAASVTETAAPAGAVVARSVAGVHDASLVASTAQMTDVARSGVPDTVLAAYSLASAVAPARCHLPVTLLMAVGQVESGNLAGVRLDRSHRPDPPIVGRALDGKGAPMVPDTDAGEWDGDAHWDHAVGPMRLLPSAWRVAGVDLDGDGRRDPQDVYDAAGAVMVYLCSGSRDLATPEGVRGALLGFNHSPAYLRVVLRWMAAFDQETASPDSASFMAWAVPGPTAGTGLPEAAGSARDVTPTGPRSLANSLATTPATTAGSIPASTPAAAAPANGAAQAPSAR